MKNIISNKESVSSLCVRACQYKTIEAMETYALFHQCQTKCSVLACQPLILFRVIKKSINYNKIHITDSSRGNFQTWEMRKRQLGIKYFPFSVKFVSHLHLEMGCFHHLRKPVARNVSSLWRKHKASLAVYSVIADKAWKQDYNFQSCSMQWLGSMIINIHRT